MEEKSLKLMGADKTFFSKISTTISKILLPTKIGLNGMLISLKRTAMIKAYENYMSVTDDITVEAKENIAKKYEDAYTLYLEAIDKYIMDSVYKKVKSGTASEFEREALSEYYTVINLKKNNYLEYKYRKQKYLLELDYDNVQQTCKEKVIIQYENVFLNKAEGLYKGILKNFAVKLADSLSNRLQEKDDIFDKIFTAIEEYCTKILKLKIEKMPDKVSEDVKTLQEKVERFEVGKLDEKDLIEKNMILLAISRQLFTHSLPLVAAEQCYIKLLKDARKLILASKSEIKRENAYEMLISLIDDYNVKLLSTKVYWDDPQIREDYKKFWGTYKQIVELKKQDMDKFIKEREILFLKYDVKKLSSSKTNYEDIIKLHKDKLVKLGAMKTIKDSYKIIENLKYIKRSNHGTVSRI